MIAPCEFLRFWDVGRAKPVFLDMGLVEAGIEMRFRPRTGDNCFVSLVSLIFALTGNGVSLPFFNHRPFSLCH